MRIRTFALTLFLSGILFGACAFDLIHVKQIPAQIRSTQLSEPSFELEKEVTVSLGHGYTRKLKKGTRWHYVGAVSYGDVFRTRDQILTIEASNIHEAYIVVSAGRLVGFYLPVERSYSPLGDPQALYTRDIVK